LLIIRRLCQQQTATFLIRRRDNNPSLGLTHDSIFHEPEPEDIYIVTDSFVIVPDEEGDVSDGSVHV
jgi:hypothetical protein